MRLVKDKSKVEVDGQVDNAKVTMGPKAYSILTGVIYKNKTKALIRELACNAVDSHIEVGSSDPIHVHLPSYDDPTFYVEDFGLGMNNEDVEIFTTFFESTKDMSNKQVGCLGLGSKVFYGYNTRTATVTATKDGVRRIYSFFMKDGIPCRTKLFEEQTDARNGVKIEFPVAKNDVHSFVREAGKVFAWFDFPLHFTNGNPEYPISPPQKILESDTYYFVDSRDDAVVLMGNIAYHVEVSDSILEPYSDFINNSGLVIKAPIGAVDFDPSREGLGYTTKTKVFLCKQLEKIKKELQEKVSEKVNEVSTHYEAVLLGSELLNQGIVSKADINVTYNKTGDKIDKRSAWGHIKIKGGSLYQRKFDRSYRGSVSDSTRRFGYDANQVFVVNDLKTGFINRIRKYVKDNNKKVVLLEATDDYTLEELYKAIGIDDTLIVKTSDMEAPPKQAKGTQQYVSDIMLFKPCRGWTATSRWEKVTNIDITKTKGIFVVRKAFQGEVGGKLLSHDELAPMITKLPINDVYGVKKGDVDELKKNGWTLLDDYIIGHYKKKLDKMVTYDCFRTDGILITYSRDSREVATVRNFIDHFPEIKDDVEFLTFDDKDMDDINLLGDYDFRRVFDTLLGDDINKKKTEVRKRIDEAKKNVRAILKKYPLLRKINDYSGSTIKEMEYYLEGKKQSQVVGV